MLSRVAENIYWMARYVERAESIARLIEVNRQLMLDSRVPAAQQWEPLVSIFGEQENFHRRHARADEESVLDFMVRDGDNPNSLASCLRFARENGRSVRDQISAESWLQLNKMYLEAKEATARGAAALTPEFLERVKLGGHLFFGLMSDTMCHEEGYRWAQLGRYLERADKTSRVLDVKYFILLPRVTDVGSPTDVIQWMAVLKSVSGYQMYWSMKARIEPTEVVRFLLQHPTFPRSIVFSLRRAQLALGCLSDGMEGAESLPPVAHAAELGRRLESARAEDVLATGLHEFIDDLQGQLNVLHGEIDATFFANRPVEAG